jgi:hypothetical protein
MLAVAAETRLAVNWLERFVMNRSTVWGCDALLLDRGKQQADQDRDGRRDDKKFDQREAGYLPNGVFHPVYGLVRIFHIYYSSLVNLSTLRMILSLSAEIFLRR